MGGASQNGIYLRLPGQWDDGTWDDASSGADVYYNVHRFLAPGIGRYTRPDPLGLEAYHRFKFDGLPPDLLYVYADSNPLVAFDLLGLKVEVCSRPADLPVIGALGLPHEWINTDTRSGGMGRANGEVPGQGQCDCPGIPTAVVDHSTESGTDITCTEVEDVDEECVNRLIQPGRPTGPWIPVANDCWRFVDNVISKCRSKEPPFNPGRPGYRQSPLS
jgi:RHS repeat-associated protein